MTRKHIEGVVEREARAIRRRTNIQHVLLHTISVAGVLSVALLAPNALQVLKMFDRGKARAMNPKYLFGSAFTKLLLKGHIVVENTGHGKRIRLTEIGEQALAQMISRHPDTRKHKRWDKRWRLVIYDIRERQRRIRMRLQELLLRFGFYKLQNSVWVYPYDSEELVILLKANFKVGQEVLYLVVEKIENDRPLKEYFGLK
ncbi:MAG: CRISPR-associated endonuclease Cas2 [Patescibacteria group bacterium]